MNGFEARLAELGLELPEVPRPTGLFAPFAVTGDLAFLAGQTCEWNGRMLYMGKVGLDHDVEAGYAAARICGLNLVAALRLACRGDLDRVAACVRLGGFVNCDADFPDPPKVVNGASELMLELFGDVGRHCRTAVGVAALPGRALVEVDAVFRLRQ